MGTLTVFVAVQSRSEHLQIITDHYRLLECNTQLCEDAHSHSVTVRLDLFMRLGILCSRWPCVVLMLDMAWTPPALIVEVRSCDFCCKKSLASGALQHLLVFDEAQISLLVVGQAAVVFNQQFTHPSISSRNYTLTGCYAAVAHQGQTLPEL